MVTRNKHWQEYVLRHCVKLKLTAVTGSSLRLHPGSCEAYAEMLSTMATELDKATDSLQVKNMHIKTLERQVAILIGDPVTLEGNNVS